MRRLLLAAACLLLASEARAYVLPADYMLKLLIDKRKELKITDLSLTLTTEIEGADAPVDERLYIKVPERLRRVTEAGETPTLFIEREGQRAAGPETALKPESGPALDVLVTLLHPAGKDMEEMGARVMKTLKAAGIDTSITSFGRMGEQVVYIIGARSYEPNKPQLWLNKNTFLPVRYNVVGADKALHETRWLEWGGSVTNELYPQVVESYTDGKLVRRAEVQKLQSNQNLPETLFDVPRG